ncbi:hypothetical protein WN51_07565 [Melipona quadrifasciata]|uniref:Uncharacterized protein n=1 Tax=Melipona quadrifasciata TaxID=166423 RepID=A0A0N0BJ57_9HYME|nr:hypothetical protein WN51_07565 [Melipona quadrifasciata]
MTDSFIACATRTGYYIILSLFTFSPREVNSNAFPIKFELANFRLGTNIVLLLMNENIADVMLAVKPARLFKSSGNSSLSMVVGTGTMPMDINMNSIMATIDNHSRLFGSKFCSSSIKCNPRSIIEAITKPHDTAMRILLPYRSIRYTLIQPTTIPETRNIAPWKRFENSRSRKGDIIVKLKRGLLESHVEITRRDQIFIFILNLLALDEHKKLQHKDHTARYEKQTGLKVQAYLLAAYGIGFNRPRALSNSLSIYLLRQWQLCDTFKHTERFDVFNLSAMDLKISTVWRKEISAIILAKAKGCSLGVEHLLVTVPSRTSLTRRSLKSSGNDVTFDGLLGGIS